MSVLHNALLVGALTSGLLLTAAWASFLGYWLFKLVELVF
jgi:hypothetical protein